MPKSQLIIIAGTNGVGKSTFGKELEERYQIPFINKDLYYKNKYGGYLDFTHEQIKATSQELEKKRLEYFTEKKSFAYEDVLTKEGAIYALLRQARDHGFETSLIYLGVDTNKTSNIRIENRVKEGAHFVDPEIVQKNTQDSIATFKKVASKFDSVTIYDNSNTSEHFSPKRIYDIRKGVVKIDAQDKPLWACELVEAFDKKNIKANDRGMGLTW